MTNKEHLVYIEHILTLQQHIIDNKNHITVLYKYISEITIYLDKTKEENNRTNFTDYTDIKITKYEGNKEEINQETIDSSQNADAVHIARLNMSNKIAFFKGEPQTSLQDFKPEEIE